jgi:asparagine synthase (glutamine-hydrolysing)
MVSGMNLLPSESIPWFREQRDFHARYKKLKNILTDPDTRELMRNLNQVFTSEELPELLSADFSIPDTPYDSTDFINPEYDPVSFMMAVDFQTYLPDDILTKVDRATMGVGLEGREPFLDQHIVEWAARLPTNYKYYQGQKKYILKQIVNKFIPASMMERPKMGFAVPVKDWLLNELKPLVHEVLSEKSLNRHGLLNTQTVSKLLHSFYAGRSEHYLRIWYLLMFQMWYDQWMKGSTN